MATAEELLASAGATEEFLVVNPDTRVISIPATITNLGVESDDDVKKLRFKVPRYYGDIDLAAFKVQINFINPLSTGDVYPVKEFDSIDKNFIIFTWEVDRSAFATYGDVKFNVCMKLYDDEGVVVKEWNTTYAVLPVLQGLETQEEIVENNPSVLDQILYRLDAVEAAAGNGQEVHYSTNSSTIINEVSGESITLLDSANDPVRGLKLYGKTTQITTTGAQLLDFYRMRIDSGGTTGAKIIDSGKTVTITGTKAYAMGYIDVDVTGLVGKTLYLSGSKSGGNTPSLTARLIKADGSKTYVTALTTGYTVLADDATISLQFIANNTATNLTSETTATFTDVMISAVEGASWEPYTGGKPSPNPIYPQELVNVTRPTVKICGKNLMDDSQLVHHPEYKDMYSSALSVLNYHVRKGETYTISFDTENTGVRMYLNPSSGFTYTQFTMDGNRHSFTTTMNKDVTNSNLTLALVSIAATSAFACGAISNVQIEYGDTATGYEPYVESTINIPRVIPGLPGIIEGNYTDSDGKLWICDEVDFERGVYVQRLAHYVFDGSADEEWEGIFTLDYYETPYVTISLERSREISGFVPLLCNYSKRGYYGEDIICYIGSDGSDGEFRIGGAFPDGVLDSLTTFKAHIAEHPIELVYPLESAIEIKLSDTELTAFKELKTNLLNTTIINDSGAMMSVKYNADLKTWLVNYISDVVGAVGNGNGIKSITITEVT